jgi:hypothetical protein
MKTVHIFLVLILVFLLSMSFWLSPGSLAIKIISATDVISMLSSFFLIALILERSLEVFITTWRAEEADKLDLEIQNLKDKISQRESKNATSDELDPLRDNLKKTIFVQTNYRSQTQRIALYTGLAVGIAVATAGIRMLHLLVDPNTLATFSKGQMGFFRVVDIILTGGLIAGGSDGIHKIANVYDNFMNSTATKKP